MNESTYVMKVKIWLAVLTFLLDCIYFPLIALWEMYQQDIYHTLSWANSICSQLIEQFAQQLSTIGHQCAGILMFITDRGVTSSCKREKASARLCFTTDDTPGMQTCWKGQLSLHFLKIDASHFALWWFVLIVVFRKPCHLSQIKPPSW